MKIYNSKELVTAIMGEQVRRNVSRKAILKIVGVSAPTFSRWRHGSTLPEMKKYLSVIKKLGLK